MPEELQNYVLVDTFELFLSSDSCANEIFNFKQAEVVSLSVSKLFIDTNRPYTALPPATNDGVIKKKTPHGKDIYAEDFFPNSIALTNLIRRYYQPFHDSIASIL
ncbi:MAG: N-formylglutamate amidohydrolase, partial [Spirochaetota bacterium]